MANAALEHHNRTQFEKTIIELAPGIWGAVGFAASCVYMIEGAHSVTIIDTSESTRAAENILAEFRQRTDKPVGRIIYTHSHRDHISGASVFAPDGPDGPHGPDGKVPILASSSFSSDLVGVDMATIAPNKALGRRTQAQFGIGLSDEERISLGCGPGNRPMQGLGAGYLPPTQSIAADCEIDLDGVAARLMMAPGETSDHMVVFLPETRVLFGGDNWYHAFPNLYAIRGTPYRDFGTWAKTLGMLANLGAEVLAPGHTRPVLGAENVRTVLTTTRDAIVHVMRETASMMDQGLSMDDIAARVQLPDDLANRPWLGEFYGRIDWSARAFAAGTLGWYDGNPTHMGTLSSRQRAAHLAKLAGGVEALMQAATSTQDLQWRLELCDHLLALDAPSHHSKARLLKAEAMEVLAEDEINATARNTYLWEAKQLRQVIGDKVLGDQVLENPQPGDRQAGETA